MSVSLAAIALQHTNVFGGWCDSETMFAIYKGSANKVAHDETRTRVIDIKPESPRIRVQGVSGEAQPSDTTIEQLRLYLRFSHGFVSTECNVGPIINIILLELLVLMAI